MPNILDNVCINIPVMPYKLLHVLLNLKLVVIVIVSRKQAPKER